jgi:hypothetical protein
MLIASVLVGLLEIGVLVLLFYAGVEDRSQTAEIRRASQAVEAEIADLDREAANLAAELQQPANAEVLGRTAFLNTLLVRKGISWTRLFADLEQVTPYNVRLISIRPQVESESRVLLDMVLGGQTKEAVIDMLQRLEGAGAFGETFVHNWLPPTENEPLFRYRISVNYAQEL